MTSQFDEIIDRRQTDCLKYDFAEQRGKPLDVLPMWVADMDFRAPEAVITALEEKSRHGIFGYSDSGPDYFSVIQGWFERHFAWQVQPEWLVKTPGVVFAICAVIRSLTQPGDAVLIQQPVYYPFAESVRMNDRQLVVNQLTYENGRYQIDWQDFEDKIVRDKVRLFILCSPHNPVGRVWTAAELVRMGDICLKYGVKVISDEIHADFVSPGHQHLIFASLNPAFLDNTITCTAPTKTFNLAGLQVSNIFIANQEIRQLVHQEVHRSGYSQLNIMGLTAAKAAYQYGDPWLDELRDYLQGNFDLLRQFLLEKLQKLRLVEPEGTYLAWLDCRGLGLSDGEINELITHKAHLWLDAGTMFGAGGEGFQRINIACPRSVLLQALTQLEQAIGTI